MKTLLNIIQNSYNYCLEMSQRRRTLEQLRQLTERSLIDKGFAPHLVETGLSAYPWTPAPEIYEPIKSNFSQAELVIEEKDQTIHYATAA